MASIVVGSGVWVCHSLDTSLLSTLVPVLT